MEQVLCSVHTDYVGRWRCGVCGQAFCNECVILEDRSNGIVQLCPSCHSLCQPILVEATRGQMNRSFFAQLIGVMGYPFRGFGPAVIFCGALTITIVSILCILPMVVLFLGPMIYGILAAYCFKIIAETAAGRMDPPGWADMTSWWHGIIRPILLFLSAILVSFTPLLVYLIFDEHWFDSGHVIDWVFLVWGVFYLPMALISVAMYDSFGGLNPLRVVPAILKVGAGYIVAVLLLGAFLVAAQIASSLLDIPVPLLGTVLRAALLIYLIMVEMHVCGLLYWAYEDKLDWFSV